MKNNPKSNNINKRGQFGLIGLGLVGIVALIILAVLYFSESIRYMVIGGGILAMSFVVFLKSPVKNDKIKAGIFIVLLLVGLVFIVSSGVMQSITFKTLSISKVTYDEGDSKILVYASTSGAEALRVTLSPSVLNSYLDDEGVYATKTVELTAEIQESSVSFPYVTNADDPINVLQKLGTANNVAFSGLEECRQVYPNTDVAVYEDTYWFTRKLGCYEWQEEGNIDLFSTGTTKADTKIKFTYNGASKTISSTQNQVSFNGAKVTWSGNLVGNTIVTNPSYQLYRLGNNIRLVQGGANSKIASAYNSLQSCFQNAQSGGGTGSDDELDKDKFDACYTTYQNILTATLKDKKTEYESNSQEISSIDTISNGVLRASLTSPTFIPTFTIELDAEEVGIVKLSGNPEIVSCPKDVSLDGSGSGISIITIKNIGQADGYFLFDTSSTDSKTSCQISPVSIGKGSIKSPKVFYSGSITGTSDVNGRCNIKVYDSNNPSNYDTCNFNINVEYNSFTSECDTNGETKCSADNTAVLTCTSGVWQSALCGENEVCSGGQCLTIGGGSGNDGCEWYQEYYEADVKEWKWYNYLSGGLIKPDVVTERGCKTAGWVAWLIVAVIVISLGSLAILSTKKKPKRRRK